MYLAPPPPPPVLGDLERKNSLSPKQKHTPGALNYIYIYKYIYIKNIVQ